MFTGFDEVGLEYQNSFRGSLDKHGCQECRLLFNTDHAKRLSNDRDALDSVLYFYVNHLNELRRSISEAIASPTKLTLSDAAHASLMVAVSEGHLFEMGHRCRNANSLMHFNHPVSLACFEGYTVMTRVFSEMHSISLKLVPKIQHMDDAHPDFGELLLCAIQLDALIEYYEK